MLPLPERISDYVIVGKLGEGGMGIVYEAEQQHPKRRVALKVVRGGRFVGETEIKMFEREAETLARLKHPNIAAIYESGRTENGQHFFAMELVRGEPLDAHAKRHTGITVRERLRLFLQICDAVNYAHQRGVIHRDLKPSNILVVEEEKGNVTGSASSRHLPQIKILDFGLARITDADVDASIVSEVGAIKGTLPYMSPEQVRGLPEEIDLRTDVYSLGVLLYQLLTGTLPYDTHKASIVEAARVICEDAPRPLRAAGAATRGLDGDLGTIIFKALEKAPDRRYQSAAAIGDDIQRYLTSQPILARPPSTVYQLRKLVTRHRLAFSAAAAFLILLSGFAITMTVQAGRVARERDRARIEAARATALNGFMKEMLAAANPWMEGRQDATILDALATATRKIDTSFRDQPLLRVEAIEGIAATYSDLQRTAPAESLYRVALAIRRDELKQVGAPLARLTSEIGYQRKQAGDLPEAERLLREALAMDQSVVSGRDSLIAQDLERLAAIVRDRGRYAEAESLSRASMALNVRVFGPASLPVADNIKRLASIATNRGERARADSLTGEAWRIRSALLGPKHPIVIESLADRGTHKLLLGKYAEAESLLTLVVGLNTEVVGRDHPETASTTENLAQVYFRQGRNDEALGLLTQVFDIRRRALGDSHPAVARTITNMASICLATGRFEEALQYAKDGADRFRQTLGPQNVELATALSEEARAMMKLKRNAEAEVLQREVLAIRRAILPEGAVPTRLAQVELGELLVSERNYVEAESLLLTALEEQDEQTPLGPATRQRAVQALVDLYTARGQPDNAAKYRAQMPPRLDTATR